MKTIAILMATLMLVSVMPMIAAEDNVIAPADGENAITIVDAGTTPDSPFYGLDRAMERLKLAFMAGKVEKALYRIQIAEERLAEAEKMLKENKLNESQEAEDAHDQIIEEAEQDAEAIDSDDGQAVAEKSLEDVEKIQISLLSHSEKIAFVHNRILDMMRANNASEEKLAHIGQVFAKIINKSQEMEQKMAEKRDKIRTRYKVLSEKNETELTEKEQAFLDNMNAIKERKAELKERIQEKLHQNNTGEEPENETGLGNESESAKGNQHRSNQ